MLKKLAKRVNKELNMACDYVEQAMLIKHEHREAADLFVALASERIDDIERLYRLGFNLINAKEDGIYSRSSTSDTEHSAKSSHFEEAKTIWDWEYRISNEKVAELKQRISAYKR